MPQTSLGPDQVLKVNADVELVRTSLCRIRDAHQEFSLGEMENDDDEAILRKERRSAVRAQLQLPVVLVPVDWSTDDDQQVVVCDEEQIGVTRDVSPTGIGLTHDHQLGSDAVVVQFDLPDEEPLGLVLDLRWSVRKSQYSYMSGGCVVCVVELHH